MRQIVQAIAAVLVLGACAGLVLGAIVKVREASRRMQCQNNLRQIGLSLGNYQDCRGHYPAAAIPNPELSPDSNA
ncbi:MAG TPA: DUF1559 domain-containing protein, partial [Gemmataceae bacterium]|nr:DUF1559 domain-containing protein [Gemmataceae bacterium]